jgi:NDP-sugar pyrophosphorylase family protein
MREETDVRKAVILAAGRGTRLGSITEDKPKPMVPVQGVPVLEHIIRGLEREGIREFLFIVGYKRHAIEGYFEDGSRWNVSIRYAVQEILNGTGGALSLGGEFAESQNILSSYGDILTSYRHYSDLLADFRRGGAAGVLGINYVDDPSAGGAVYRDGGRVTKVIEKPPSGTSGSNWNLAGINVFSPEIFTALDAITLSPRGELELTDAIANLIEGGREVRAVELHDFWSDIGTPAALESANRSWVV